MPHPVLLAVAPNGARRLKADHPAIPLTATELGREAARCRVAGAAMIHLHVRDRDGGHSLDVELYRQAIAEVRREAGTELLIQATTEAVGIYRPGEQMAAMDGLQPEAFSVAVREVLATADDESAGAAFVERHASRGCLIQYILYDTADMARFDELIARGLIPTEGASVIFPLGRYAVGQQSGPADLLPFLAAWRHDLPWMVCAFGRREAACAITAAGLGGHVRIGFENNMQMPDGRTATDNAELVACVASAAGQLGLPLASTADARRCLAGKAIVG